MQPIFLPGKGLGNLDADRSNGEKLIKALLIRTALRFEATPEGAEVWETVCNRLTELGVAINAVSGMR